MIFNDLILTLGKEGRGCGAISSSRFFDDLVTLEGLETFSTLLTKQSPLVFCYLRVASTSCSGEGYARDNDPASNMQQQTTFDP